MMTRDMNVKNVGKHLFGMTIWQNTKKYIQVGSWLQAYYFEIKPNKKLIMEFIFQYMQCFRPDKKFLPLFIRSIEVELILHVLYV